MPSILSSLRLLSDPARLRILLLLEKEELSVAELQEILSMGQSTVSTHLSQLKTAGLVEDRRSGKSALYRLKPSSGAEAELSGHLLTLLRSASREIPETLRDGEALELAMRKRRDRTRAHFDELAGRFGRHFVPGRSWKGIAEMLLRMMPPLVVADLGAGEATFSLLMAKRAAKVIAVDSSAKMVEYGTELAARFGVDNLDYRQGDMEDLPVESESVDLAFFSQALHHALHPERAVAEAWRILKPGGRIAVLDLARHNFEEARELYADLWLGFTEVELVGFLRNARFQHVETATVHREEQSPHFETLLAVGDK